MNMIKNRAQKEEADDNGGKWGTEPWVSSPASSLVQKAYDSPRCSSMSLTDLVEVKSSLREDPSKYNLASNRSSLGNQIQHEFAPKEADMDAPWTSPLPGQSSPSRKSVSKRDSHIRSMPATSIGEPVLSTRGPIHGVLQCSLRDGLPCYTFLLDDYDEVVTAKIWMEDIQIGESEGAWRYTFYSLRGESNNKRKGRRGWKHWSPKEKLVSELAGRMTVASVLCPGDINSTWVRSEFVLSSVKAPTCSSPILKNDEDCHSHCYSLNSSSSLESGSHACPRKSSSSTYNHMVLMNMSSASPSPSPSASPSPLSDGLYSSFSSPSAISAWYVSQSLIPSNLASPEHSSPSSSERKQKPRRWILRSKAWVRKARKSNRVGASSNFDDSPDAAHVRLGGIGLNSELAAMIIHVPLDLRHHEGDEALLSEMPAHPEWCGLHDDISRSDAEIEPRKSVFDLRNECLKQPNITVILPSGCHGRPSGSDSKGPSPLIKRWREGGKCDCKGWDLGCGMMVLTDQQTKFSPGMESSRLGFYKNDGKHLALYKQDGDNEDAYICLAPRENGLIAVDFRAPLSPLQAFAMAVAILHGRGSGVPDQHASTSSSPTSLSSSAPSPSASSHAHMTATTPPQMITMAAAGQCTNQGSNLQPFNPTTTKNPVMPPNHDDASSVAVNDVFGCASTLSFDRL